MTRVGAPGPAHPDLAPDPSVARALPYAPAGLSDRRARVLATMHAAQSRLVDAFEAVEATAATEALVARDAAGDGDGDPVRFAEHVWTRPTGGGGRARVIEEGRVFERGGVNVSAVLGARVPPSLAEQHPGTEGKPFFATGVSMVLHPRNPYVPAFHANFRYFEVGGGTDDAGDDAGDDAAGGDAAAGDATPYAWWFGGGSDLTPAYPVEDEVRAFHAELASWCARHPQADYGAWKATCDAYFTVRHRQEMRGVGGVFFDELTSPDAPDHAFEADLACIRDGVATLLPSYLPMVEAHRGDAYGERERGWQALRRGRYVEFNLVYDRGTTFGLQTGGNVEAILMSMPPRAGWRFDHHPEPGTPEADALAFYQPR
ncbi:MAG: coproporphyrinogen III oxidase, partial [Trueperaceae bacterium]|nr:coproporphyrinogen III oxidase [Trueperaceae bacterium]